jgi:nucleoside phosphorylase
MAAAGGGTARALARSAARRVVLLGSCGAYPGSGLTLLSLVAPRRALAVDAASIEGRAALPHALPKQCDSDATLHDALLASAPGVCDGTVATTLGITTDDALAQALARDSGCNVENLEALAVGLACAAQNVAFAALLCCTNEVGALGRSQWAQHHARAAELTANALMRWLEQPLD